MVYEPKRPNTLERFELESLETKEISIIGKSDTLEMSECIKSDKVQLFDK